jgi:hypothetical protein
VRTCPRCDSPWNPVDPEKDPRGFKEYGDSYCKCNWWEPSQIIWQHKQMMFLCYWYGDYWPEQPGTENVQTGESHTVKSCAGFEEIACFNAEMDMRLKTTGRAGETLLHEISVMDLFKRLFEGEKGEIYSEFEYYRMLSPLARDCVNYISGKRRSQTFAGWCADRERQRKNHKSMVKEIIISREGIANT